MIAGRLSTALGRRLPGATISRLSKSQQRRWAQVHDVRFLATTQAPRNVAERYREKLNRKAQAEGLRDVGELKAVYADRIEELKKRDNIHVPGLDALLADAAAPEPSRQSQPQTQRQSESRAQTQSTPPRPPTAAVKPLSEILDLPKVRGLSAEALSTIWRARHAEQKNSLCAVVPTTTYGALEETARASPRFVLPLLREGQGAEMHYLQWTFDAASRTSTVLFTQLAEYKARGEWAQPHTTITHYPDYGTDGLSTEGNQGVVLMAGSVVEGRGITVDEARFLIMLLQRFYGGEGLGGDPAKRRLVEEFARADGGFSVEKLMEESQRLS
ncbi:ATP11 protein-domain-containing protein [Xylaria sp. CBS 124048]|nr:ATP11 protein-domain-containing protein [Xylaria sp. CBS 124048]